MDDTILRTKFHMPPAPPSCLMRRPLLRQLNAGLSVNGQFLRRLTQITAPAGYGKTTLAVSWIEERISAGAWQRYDRQPLSSRKATVLWLTLEATDRQPAHFFRYLFSAMLQGNTGIENSIPRVDMASPLPGAEILARELVNGLANTERAFVLVLDDFHHAPEVAEEWLRFLLAHQPPNLHLIVTSRTMPQGLPLAQLSVRQQVLICDQSHLRFSESESKRFLQARLSPSTTDSELQAIARLADGWVGGLQLSALAWQRSDLAAGLDPARALEANQQHLASYLAEEVLAQQTPVWQTFLLRTSILRRLCTALCQAVVETLPPPAASEPVPSPEALAARGLFISRVDSEGYWYRYHELFRMFLLDQLQKTQAALVPQLHRRAAEWYRENGAAHDAVEHALASGDGDYALELMESYVPWLVQRGELTTLIDWLQPVPDIALQTHPTLGLALTWANLIQGATDRAAALVAALEPVLADTQSRDLLAIRLAVSRRRGDIDAARAYAKQAAALVPPGERPRGSILDLYQAELLLGSGKPAEARRLIVKALQTFRADNEPFMETQALYYLVNVHIVQGQLKEAAALCHEALRVMEQHHLPYRAGGFHNRLGRLHWEWGELDEAADYLLQGAAIARKSEQISFFVRNGLLLATVWQDQNHNERVGALLDEVRRVAARSPQALTQLTYWQAWTALRQGQPAAATQWVAARGLAPDDDPDYYSLEDYLLLARLRRLQGRTVEAGRLLRSMLACTRQVGDTGMQIQVLLELGHLYLENNEPERARRVVREALASGSPGGYVQRFVRAGARLVGLVAEAGDLSAPDAAPFDSDYLQAILAACGVSTAADASRASFRLTEPLTSREGEIARLLARGMSNPQIAAHLHISAGTVRWHVKNIYKKLDVNNRVQATRRLQALGRI